MQESTIELIYFNCRGMCQPIRFTLFEIGVAFQQTFIELDSEIPPHLHKYKIDAKSVPCILHQGRVVGEVFPIIHYLCHYFDRMDLLGRTLASQSQLVEIMHRFERRKASNLMIMLKSVEEFLKNPQRQRQIKVEMLTQFKRESPRPAEACIQLYADSGSFLLGENLTVLDFIFYEQCFYMTGMFSDIAKKTDAAVFAFKNFFQKTTFYQQNRQSIEKYRIFMPHFDIKINEGFRRMWKGDKKFL